MHHPNEVITGAVTQESGLNISPLIWLLVLAGIGIVITIYYLTKSKKKF